MTIFDCDDFLRTEFIFVGTIYGQITVVKERHINSVKARIHTNYTLAWGLLTDERAQVITLRAMCLFCVDRTLIQYQFRQVGDFVPTRSEMTSIIPRTPNQSSTNSITVTCSTPPCKLPVVCSPHHHTKPLPCCTCSSCGHSPLLIGVVSSLISIQSVSVSKP